MSMGATSDATDLRPIPKQTRLSDSSPTADIPAHSLRGAERFGESAVRVLALRLFAEQVVSEELLVGRACTVEALERGIAFAPIGSGVRAHVTEVQVRKYDPAAAKHHYEFRVLNA